MNDETEKPAPLDVHVQVPPGQAVTRKQCGATKKSGDPCQLPPVLGTGNSYSHAPQLAAERAVASRRGGLVATGQRVLAEGTVAPALGSPTEIRALMESTVANVLTGKLAPNIANSVGYLVSVALRLAELELSARVAAMEQELFKTKRRTP